MEEALKDKVLKLRRQGLVYSEITKKLNCTLSTVSYHCKNEGLENHNKLRSPSEKEIEDMQSFYNECKSSIKTAEKFGWSKFTVLKYVKIEKRKVLTEGEKNKRNVNRSLEARRKSKEKLVEYKGGECECCGYNRCIKALEFHHVDPKKKEFGITSSNRKFEILKKEADKCILVCATCHREIEYGFIDVYEDKNGNFIINKKY